MALGTPGTPHWCTPLLGLTAYHGEQRLRNPYSPSDAFRPHVMKILHLEGGATRPTR
jgi:hypothetical protein